MSGHEYESKLKLTASQMGGDPANFSVRIESVTVGEGEPIRMPKPGVTLIVGGNNAGKSTLLRQMYERFTGGWAQEAASNPAVLTDQVAATTGSEADAIAWLGHNSALVKEDFQRNGEIVSVPVVSLVWGTSRAKGRFDSLGRALSLAPNARTRFDMTLPVARRPDIADAPNHPLHYYEDDPELFAELDSYSHQIFGTGLTLDPLSGQLMLRFGKVDVEAPRVGTTTPAYRQALIELSTIDKQGDGIGSTLGLLIPLVAGRNPVAFVDEPEAFLHPPQAFKLGATVAEIAGRSGGQVVIATHDRNFVAGVLSKSTVETLVVRLDRSRGQTVAHSVEPESLRKVWSSATLRHSNVLDGLFHRGVVIAENERDCVFFAAATEAHSGLPSGLLPTDLLYVSSHGKGGMVEIAQILTAAHVPVVASPDLDIVNNKSACKELVIAVGGVWTDSLDSDYDLATAEFRVPRQQVTRGSVKRLIDGVLANDESSMYDSATRDVITAALKVDSPWQELKKHGMGAFRSDRAAADRLVSQLADQGVVVVLVGELERFAPALGVAKGKSWLPAALAANAQSSVEAAGHAGRIADSILESEARAVITVTGD